MGQWAGEKQRWLRVKSLLASPSVPTLQSGPQWKSSTISPPLTFQAYFALLSSDTRLVKLPECSLGISAGDYSNQNLNEGAKEWTSLAFTDFGLVQLLKTTYLTGQHSSVL